MKYIAPKSLFAATAIFSLLSGCVSSDFSGNGVNSRSQIESQIRQLEIALTNLDGELYASVYTEDADVIIQGGPLVSGRAGIYDDIEDVFDRNRRDGLVSNPTRLEIQSIRFLTDGVALVDCVSSSSGARATYIMTNVGGEWLVASGRIMPAERE